MAGAYFGWWISLAPEAARCLGGVYYGLEWWLLVVAGGKHVRHNRWLTGGYYGLWASGVTFTRAYFQNLHAQCRFQKHPKPGG